MTYTQWYSNREQNDTNEDGPTCKRCGHNAWMDAENDWHLCGWCNTYRSVAPMSPDDAPMPGWEAFDFGPSPECPRIGHDQVGPNVDLGIAFVGITMRGAGVHNRIGADRVLLSYNGASEWGDVAASAIVQGF